MFCDLCSITDCHRLCYSRHSRGTPAQWSRHVQVCENLSAGVPGSALSEPAALFPSRARSTDGIAALPYRSGLLSPPKTQHFTPSKPSPPAARLNYCRHSPLCSPREPNGRKRVRRQGVTQLSLEQLLKWQGVEGGAAIWRGLGRDFALAAQKRCGQG